MIRRFYDWIMLVAHKKQAPWILALVSFLESSVSPIPPDPLLIPMVMARPKKAWFLAFICTMSSVIGGAVGYLIGMALFVSVGESILNFYHLMPAFMKLKAWFHEWGFWVIMVKGLTPVPYKVVTITAGATALNLWTFLLASFLSRGFRFFLEAFLLYKYGARLDVLLRQYINTIAIGFFALLALGFGALYYFS